MLLCYLTIGMINSLALLVLSFMIIQNYALVKKIKKGMLLSNLAATTVIIVELWITYFELGNIPFNGWYVFCNVLGFSLSPMVAVLLGNAFHVKEQRCPTYLLIPLIANLILSILSPRFGFIFQTTPDNLYLRGPYFFVYILTYLCCTIYLLYEIYLSIKKYPDSSKYTLVLLFVFILVGTTIQIGVPNIHVSWLCITFSLILCYAYLCELNLKKDALTHLFNRYSYEHCLRVWEKTKMLASCCSMWTSLRTSMIDTVIPTEITALKLLQIVSMKCSPPSGFAIGLAETNFVCLAHLKTTS